ncbi:MAG: dicarboxylate/amino acid:cation symporter [Candidatus Gastranaerophilales bacterium]|nr:dicarboxylate/amino acid:cation symporter [Candidatus Gastranaerophilales bacterium]
MKLHMQILIALGLGIKRNGHIFLGLILGIIAGVILHQYKVLPNGDINTSVAYIIGALDVIGKMFIRLIQMVVIPLVCSAIVIGIASVGDSNQLGKMGKKMILYYALITVAAVTIGSVLSALFKPGIGVQTYVNHTAALTAQEQVKEAVLAQQGNLSQLFINMIPENPIASIANGDMIPILVFALIFAIALSKVGDVARPIVGFFESVFAATMKVTDWIMYLAAPGVFALTATAISSFGTGIFTGISTYLIILAVGMLIQLCLVYPLIMKIFSKVPVATYFAAITEPLMVAFGTASSSATLPLTIACCEKRGISHKVCSFVLPLGATLNMDATALFQTVAVMFLTQAYGITLEPMQIVMVAVFAIVASSTSAGIPGAGLITLAIILNALGLTSQQLWEGLAFLFAIDRIIDMFRSMLNVTSDAVVAAVIADNEGELNYDMLNNTDADRDILD